MLGACAGALSADCAVFRGMALDAFARNPSAQRDEYGIALSIGYERPSAGSVFLSPSLETFS
jgi:hypothetical protein